MKELLGMWLIFTAIIMLVLRLECDLSLRDKVKLFTLLEGFITITMAGTYILVG